MLDLEVLSELSSSPISGSSGDAARVPGSNANAFFGKFLVDLLELFRTDRELLERRGAFIIRQLCTLLTAEKIYNALAGACMILYHVLVFISSSAFIFALSFCLVYFLLISLSLFPRCLSILGLSILSFSLRRVCNEAPASSHLPLFPMCEYAEILLGEADHEFASLMVQNLNIILLTATELFGLRRSLQSMKEDVRPLFVVLYRSLSLTLTLIFTDTISPSFKVDRDLDSFLLLLFIYYYYYYCCYYYYYYYY